MKLQDLAIYTGKPYWNPPLCVGKPSTEYAHEFLKRAEKVFDRGILANNGPEVQELEERMCAISGKSYAVAVTNATAGLELCLRAIDPEGDKVIVPTWTFPAAPQAVLNAGLTPIFVDAFGGKNPRNLGLSHQPIWMRLGQLLRSDCDIGVAIGFLAWGTTDRLASAIWVDRYTYVGIPIIFDAAHALGCEEAKAVGGLAHVYSLHATKQAGGFEGGVICTNDALLYCDLRRARNFGFSAGAAIQIEQYGYPQVEAQGRNAKMHEISAAMANVSLSHLERTIVRFRKRHEWYRANLRDVEGITLLDYPAGHNYQYVVLHWAAPLATGELCRILYAEGVRARRYFAPGCHKMTPFRDYARGQEFPNADYLSEHTVVLPTGPQMGRADVERVCEILGLLAKGDDAYLRDS